ncbi:MAG: hypothetical protein FWD38_12005 [Oscillospiraceae bacterium]|nr:hypothetical protein [Oscillospiraceae bacterium]
MSYSAHVYKVFIATPDDVKKEREIIRQAIHKLNEDFSSDGVFIPVMYEQLPPTAGIAPQQTINTRALNNCDVLIALFWTKVGKGTKTELIKHLDAGKHAMVYKLEKGSVPSEIADDEMKSEGYRELENYFNIAKTQKSNELGLFQVIKNGKALTHLVQEHLRKIRPFLSDTSGDILDESSVESDWLMNIENDAVLAEVIPFYKPNVSRNLVLKLFDNGRENNRDNCIWDAVLEKFMEKNGSMNLARMLVGLSQRGNNKPEIYSHILFIKGTRQIYEKKPWMFENFMKKLYKINKNQFNKIISSEWVSNIDMKNRLVNEDDESQLEI